MIQNGVPARNVTLGPLLFYCLISFFLFHPFPEKFIQGLVKQLGQQNMDTLTLNDLDQLSEVITQALQVVDDVDGVKDREVMVNDESEMKNKLDPEGQLGKMSGEEFMSKGTLFILISQFFCVFVISVETCV